MTDDLRQLLQAADASAPPHSTRGDLASRVRHRAVRQRRRRSLTGGLLALVMAAGVFISLEKASRSIGPPASPVAYVAPLPPTTTTSSARSLIVEQAIAEQTVERLLASHSPRVPAPVASPLRDLQLQRDRAALILVYDAERHAKGNRTLEAIASFRRAIELFPQSHWAEVARQRLQQM